MEHSGKKKREGNNYNRTNKNYKDSKYTLLEVCFLRKSVGVTPTKVWSPLVLSLDFRDSQEAFVIRPQWS